MGTHGPRNGITSCDEWHEVMRQNSSESSLIHSAFPNCAYQRAVATLHATLSRNSMPNFTTKCYLSQN